MYTLHRLSEQSLHKKKWLCCVPPRPGDVRAKPLRISQLFLFSRVSGRQYCRQWETVLYVTSTR